MSMTATLPPPPAMYRALLERDASYEGVFFAAIRTTGIFCRPTCRARRPRRENVEYYPSARDALLAGHPPRERLRPPPAPGGGGRGGGAPRPAPPPPRPPQGRVWGRRRAPRAPSPRLFDETPGRSR